MYDLLIVVTNETLTKAICNKGFSGKASLNHAKKRRQNRKAKRVGKIKTNYNYEFKIHYICYVHPHW